MSISPDHFKRGDSRSSVTIAISEDLSECPFIQFTAKYDKAHSDAMAVFQKALGAGLTVTSASQLTIELVHQDTKQVPRSSILYWDVQARFADGRVLTAAEGTLSVSADVTRELDTSVPIFTTNPTAYQSAAESAASAAASALAAGEAQTASEAARDLTLTYRNEVAADKATVAADKAAVQTLRSETETLRDETLTLRNAVATDRTATETAATTATTQAGIATQARIDAQAAATATGLDAAATAADRVQTGLDRAAVAADLVTVQGIATTVSADRTATETARDETLAARDTTLGYRNETLTARDTALGYRDTTLTARDVTLDYRDETLTARNAAQAAAAEAEARRLAAEAAAAAALASQTAAGLSEANASEQANASAVSAALSLNAIAGQFRGGLAGNAVPATSTAAGDRYVITSSGTSQSIAWTVGDEARYNGVSGSWTRVPGYNVEVPTLRGEISTRAASGYLWGDSATTNRGQIQTPGARGNLAGAPVASWVGWADVPTANPGATCFFAALSAANPSSAQNDAWTQYIALGSNGSCQVRATGAAGSSFRLFNFLGFRAAYSGQRIWIELRITKGTSNPVVRINGVDVSGSFAVSTGGTPPEWLDVSQVATTHVAGFIWPAGPAPLGCWLNAHLTDAESEAWRKAGQPPAWVALGGSAAPIYASSFVSGVDGWSDGLGSTTMASNVAADTDGAGVPPSNGWLKMSRSLDGPIRIHRINTLTAAGRYRVAAEVFVPAGSPVTHVSFATTDASGRRVATPQAVVLTPGAVTVVEQVLEASAVVAGDRIYLATCTSSGLASAAVVAGTAIYLRNVAAQQLGALSLSGIQSIDVIDDITRIGGNQARLVGMMPVLSQPRPVSRIERPAESYSAGVSVQLLGGAITGARKRRVLAVTGNSSASTTISIGTSSSGTQIVNAQAVNGDFDLPTFVSRILAANTALWVTFAANTTAAINIHLTDL